LAYQVLARRWRPRRFDEIVGQEHVSRTLTNAITAGRLAHAFLFCGPRGVGKTTAARILAKCLNCERAKDGPVPVPCNECTACGEIERGGSLDVLEIDGASNRGIDEVRELRENVRYAPSAGRAKVYIIDEVHMLTKEAFNALLKTLEEPPSGVYFVFATTEVHRVPATIRSRCQRYDFRRIPASLIAETLADLAKKEDIRVEPPALAELARQADGGLRDAESLLDQAAAVSEGTITLESLRELLGEAPDEVILAILGAVMGSDPPAAFESLQQLLDRGMDPSRVSVALTQALRDLLIVRSAPERAPSLGVREDLVGGYRRVAEKASAAKLTACLTLAGRAVSELRRSARPRLTLEVAVARMCHLADEEELRSLAERLDRLAGPADPGGAPPSAGAARSSPAPARSKEKRAPGPADAGEEPRESAEPLAAGDEDRPRALWESLLTRVRGRKMMLASFLEHGAVVAVHEDELTAVFDNTYYEGMVTRRENLAIIHEELAAVAGKALRFRARLGQLPAGEGRPAAGSSGQRGGARDLLEANPGLARVIHDLGGRLLPGGGSIGGGGT
jgi:DNA polymerase-3 subunit gamma/tau